MNRSLLDAKLDALEGMSRATRGGPKSADPEPSPRRQPRLGSRILGKRYRRIIVYFVRVILGLVWWEIVLKWIGLRGRVDNTRPERLRQIAARFRVLAIDMGGVMIKVGQFLSSRVDVLPSEILRELSGLQDQVPAEDFPAIRGLAEAELGKPLEEAYASFESTPLAAASFGQVHRAALHLSDAIPSETGPVTAVVVKIQRPHIDEMVEVDLTALRQVARWLQHYRPIRRRANIPALLEEFIRVSREELDYINEGHNAETLAANLANRAGICVPKVDWGHTTKRILTLEDVYAIKITDYEAIEAAGIDRSAVAHRLFDAYLQQIFEDGLFHADPHPGNLFVQRVGGPHPAAWNAGPHPRAGEGEEVSPLPQGVGRGAGGEGTAGDEGIAAENEWQLTFVDFGMVGHVAPRLRQGLREMVIAIVTQDSQRLVQAYQTAGLLLPDANINLLQRAQARLFDLFGGRNVTELHEVDRAAMHEFYDDFGELMYEMPFQLPTDLLYLGRAIGILSGISTGLDPDFDMWRAIEPYAQELVSREAFAPRQWLGEAAKVGASLVAVPGKLSRVLDQVERDGVSVRVPDLNRQIARLEHYLNRLVAGIVFAALLLGGVQLELGTRHELAWVLLGGAGVTLLWLIFARRR